MTKLARYDLREDAEGWTVYDVWTGEPAVIALVPQTGLDVQDADEIAEWLTYMSDRGARWVLQ
jgi:hypothetical protein